MSLVPDRKFECYRDVTPGFLLSEGINAMLIDIDNTLAPYEQPVHDDFHSLWFAAMKEAGISCALISNNSPERVEKFADGLDVPWYANCGKPKKKYLRVALKGLGADPEHSAILGDQLLTDCLSARRMGMKSYIVPPIKDKKTLFFRFKRWLEKPFMKKYDKIHGKDADNNK